MRNVNEPACGGARPRVIDATLREGLQAPGVRLDVRASTEIAATLARLGIDAVECGHPAVSEVERTRIRAVRGVLDHVPLLCHARATVGDVRAAAEVGADWVGIFLGVNPLSLAARHGLGTREKALARIADVTSEAVKLGLKVRFTVEDTSRTGFEDALAAYRSALGAGASRICFADTVGALTPDDLRRRVADLAAALPGLPIEAHLHDDRGLALANALAALDAGASWISASVNGLGERCGIVDLAALLANLALDGRRTLDEPALLQDLSERVAAHARAPVDARRPVVGRHAFTHTSRLHRRAMEQDPKAYQWLDPTRVGRTHAFAEPALDPIPDAVITVPPVISATELRHHRHGPGERYVMIDERFVRDCRQYCIVRRVPRLDSYGAGHVDRHTHTCDSLFVFLGDQPDLTGLSVEVVIGDRTFGLDSPASVFVPAGVEHTYGVRCGGGLFINHVLSGSYNESLLDPVPLGSDVDDLTMMLTRETA